MITLIKLDEDLNSPVSRKWEVCDAFMSKEPSYDGRLFVGVSSTRIYCRPTCNAKTPKFENCTFFRSAAEAEAAGYRPCLLCHPEQAPQPAQDGMQRSLGARMAAMVCEHCSGKVDFAALAARVGLPEADVREVFANERGVSPEDYLLSCRLLLAKALLTESGLSFEEVATASGFDSEEQLVQLFKERYRLDVVKVRNGSRSKSKNHAGVITLRLAYRQPYRFGQLLRFFSSRTIVGVEKVDEASYARTARIPLGDEEACGWLKVEDEAKKSRLVLTMSKSLLPVVSQVAARVRRQFDLDCDPIAVYKGIEGLNEVKPGAAVIGTRVPGVFDPFETSVRAVLGQQISVSAANKLAWRILGAYGKPIDTPIDGLDHVFITREDVLGFEDIEKAFGELGVIKIRSRTILSIAQLLKSGELSFAADCQPEEQIETLLGIKGIGPWSANYIAMRCMSYPDAFLETDAGIKHALPWYEPKKRLALAESWRPWRSYANICLWNSLSA